MDSATQHIKPGGVVAYGQAVAMARSIISIWDPRYWNDLDICAAEGISMKQQPEEITKEDTLNGIRIFPNPAKDRLMIANNTKEAGIYEVRFYNCMGIMVQASDMHIKPGIETIDIRSLATAVYVVEVYEEGLLIKREKINVVK